MLKPRLSPCDLVFGSGLSLSTKPRTSRHGFFVLGSAHHVRHKVYQSAWRDSRRASQERTTPPVPPSSRRSPLKPSNITPKQAKKFSSKPSDNEPNPSESVSHQALRPPPESKPAPVDSQKPVTIQGVGENPVSLGGKSSQVAVEHIGQRHLRHRKLIIDPANPRPSQDLSSTRPARLESPGGPVPEDDGTVSVAARAKYLYALGKSFLTFYKIGLKNIWNNRKEYNDIKARLGNFTPEDAALYGGQKVSESDSRTIPTITRREYQLYLRTRYDLGKLLPFGLVFLVCGEFTPIVILATGSSVVPFTCRIPRQVQKDRRWFLSRLSDETTSMIKRIADKPSNDPTWRMKWELAFLNGVAPTLRPPALLGFLTFQFWVYPRLVRRGREILADTVLIRREGGFEALEPIEISTYADRFFCPEFMFMNHTEFLKTGQVEWREDAAKALISTLEAHVDLMLVRDRERIADEARFLEALSIDSGSYLKLQECQKTGNFGGSAPDQ